MTESAYLKSHIGPILAKGVAATVVARPADPQQYLGLWLLHYLQQQERKGAEQEQLRELELQRQQLERENHRERAGAVKVLEHFWRITSRKLKRERREEERLLAAIEASLEDAIEEFPSEADEDDENGEAGGNADDHYAEGDGERGATAKADLVTEAKSLASACRAALTTFMRSQYALQHLRPAHIGKLKQLFQQCNYVKKTLGIEAAVSNLLVMLLATHTQRNGEPALSLATTDSRSLSRERELIASLVDKASLQLLSRSITSHYGSRLAGLMPPVPGTPTPADEAQVQPITDAAYLRQQLAALTGMTAPVSMPLLAFRILRCLCYLFFNLPPKQVSSPAQLQRHIKPALFVKQLVSFSPVSTYVNSGKVRHGASAAGVAADMRTESEEDDADGEQRHGKGGRPVAAGGEDEDAHVQLPPNTQPRPRQVMRCARLLRLIMANNSYVTPEALRSLQQDVFEELRDDDEDTEEEESRTDAPGGVGSGSNRGSITQDEVDLQLLLLTYVQESVKKHSVVLWALLKLLHDAVQLRQSRDAYVSFLRKNAAASAEIEKMQEAFMEHGFSRAHGQSGASNGDGGSQSRNAIRESEMPEEEQFENGDEVEMAQLLANEGEGEIDESVVVTMMERFGHDRDETIALLWEGVEQQQSRVLAEARQNLRRQRKAGRGNGGSGADEMEDGGENGEDEDY